LKIKFTIRGIVFSALFAALLSVFSYLSIPLGFTPVPITLENMAVMLAGALLGPFYGFFSMLLVVILTAVGLPMLAGHGGIGYIVGYTGGYIVAWPFCALFTGWFVQRVRIAKGTGRSLDKVREFILVFVAIEVFGSLLSYVGGVPWLAYSYHLTMSKAMLGGFYPYLPGDAIKAVISTLIVLPIRRVYPIHRLVGQNHAQIVALPDA